MGREIITLCGSLKFKKQFREINERLTLQGHIVLSCGVWNKKIAESNREELQEIHFKKIEISNRIHIINVNGYIGKHTQQEIEYAKDFGKKITYEYNRK